MSKLLSPLPLTDEEKTRQPVRAWQYKAPRVIVRYILLFIVPAVIAGVIVILMGCQATDNTPDRGNSRQWEEGYVAWRESYRLGCAAMNNPDVLQASVIFDKWAIERRLSDADFSAGWTQAGIDDLALYGNPDLLICESYDLGTYRPEP